MSEKKIIFVMAFVIFFALVTLSFFQEKRFISNPKEVGWALYFEHPKLADAVFSIENPDATALFSWEVFIYGRVVEKGETNVPAKGKVLISPAYSMEIHKNGLDDFNELLIRVHDEKGKTREIIKKLNH